MAESTLSLEITELKSEIGHYLGYGRTSGNWSTAQTDNITSVLKSGLRQFYTPPPINRGDAPHSWSFLRPYTTITATTGQSFVNLDDDFGYFTGALLVTTAGSIARKFPIELTNIGRVKAAIASDSTRSGAPQLAAVEPIAGTTASEGTRFRLYVWPLPDQAYTFSGEYIHLPDALTGLLPYPPGGSEHAETIMAACLAAAELFLDDEKGPRYAYFVERLAASVAVDSRKKGTNLGYNGDNSDRGHPPGRTWRDYENNAVTYNGNPF